MKKIVGVLILFFAQIVTGFVVFCSYLQYARDRLIAHFAMIFFAWLLLLFFGEICPGIVRRLVNRIQIFKKRAAVGLTFWSPPALAWEFFVERRIGVWTD